MKFLPALLTTLLLACGSDSTDTTDAGPKPIGAEAGQRDQGSAADSATDAAAPETDASQPVDVEVEVGQADLVAPPMSGWRDRQALPAPQQEIAVVALDGLIWVMGGFSETVQQLATVTVYDPALDAWSSRADFPTTANHMNAAVVDGKIWVTGFLHMGFQADGRTFVYDPATDAWTPGPDLPPGRGRGASAVGVIGGQIYVAGGVGESGIVAQFDVLDPATGTWTSLPDAPRAFDHAGYGVIDGVLFVAAGRSGAISSYVDLVHHFDPAAGRWADGARIPTARGGVASAVHGDKLYVFGGEGDPSAPGRVFAQTEVYDPSLDRWEQLDPMTIPRHGFAAATIGDVIYLPGGAKSDAFDAVDTHQTFVP